MRFNRQMKRKRAREFSYDVYAKQKQKEAYQRRYNAAMEKIGKEWKKIVSREVPKWLQYAAEKWISPPWFDKMCLFVLRNCPSNEFIERIISAKLPYWVKWLLIMPQVWVRTLFNLVVVGPVIWLKHSVRTFGIRTKIRKKGKDKLQLRMWYWFELIEDSYWPL